MHTREQVLYSSLVHTTLSCLTCKITSYDTDRVVEKAPSVSVKPRAKSKAVELYWRNGGYPDRSGVTEVELLDRRPTSQTPSER